MRNDFFETLNCQLSADFCFRGTRKSIVALTYFVWAAGICGPVFSQATTSARVQVSGELKDGGAVRGEVLREIDVDFRQPRRIGDLGNIGAEGRAEIGTRDQKASAILSPQRKTMRGERNKDSSGEGY